MKFNVSLIDANDAFVSLPCFCITLPAKCLFSLFLSSTTISSHSLSSVSLFRPSSHLYSTEGTQKMTSENLREGAMKSTVMKRNNVRD